MLQLRQLFQIIDKSINLFLLAIGVYFIYYGGILEKFTNGYTNFAEGEEEVHELPTILTHIQYEEGYEFLEYGRHFNISYQALGSTTNPQNLTEGINTIDESGLRVNFEVQKEFSSLHKYAKSRQVSYFSAFSALSVKPMKGYCYFTHKHIFAKWDKFIQNDYVLLLN